MAACGVVGRQGEAAQGHRGRIYRADFGRCAGAEEGKREGQRLRGRERRRGGDIFESFGPGHRQYVLFFCQLTTCTLNLFVDKEVIKDSIFNILVAGRDTVRTQHDDFCSLTQIYVFRPPRP